MARDADDPGTLSLFGDPNPPLLPPTFEEVAPISHKLEQQGFVDEHWIDDWKGMPEFDQSTLVPWKSMYVHFASPEDMRAFSELVGQTVNATTKMIWFPPAEIGRFADKRWIDASLTAKVLRRPERPRGDP